MNYKLKAGDIEIKIDNQEQSLLEVLEKNNHKISYQCRQGYCGNCRLSLVKGQIEYKTEPLAFCSTNTILPCIARAKSDLEILL